MVAAVTHLLREGLPITPANADAILLDLRGVVARAVDPADIASRTAALDGTLRGLLARFSDARYAPAVRALFGLPPAEPGLNLTTRRDLAAEQAGHEVHHFRKRVEPKLIEKIAWELLADADRFTRTPMIAPGWRLSPFASRSRPTHSPGRSPSTRNNWLDCGQPSTPLVPGCSMSSGWSACAQTGSTLFTRQ